MNKQEKLVVRDLQGNVIWEDIELADESASDFFYCILEQESWAMDEILAVLPEQPDPRNHLNHSSWRGNGPTPRDDKTVIEIFIKGQHKYNLTLE